MWGIMAGLLAACLPVGIPAAEAQTSRQVVVLPFKGAKANTARLSVIRGLKGKVSFVPLNMALETATERGLDPEQPEGIVSLCAHLEIDAVVTGKVDVPRRGRYRLTVTVVDGGTGMPVGGKSATVRRKKQLPRAGAAIARSLGPLLAQTSRPVAAPSEVEATGVKVDDVAADSASESEGRGPAGLGGLFEFSLGLGISRRDYRMEGDNPTEDRRYNGGVYPEINFRLDIYPAAPFWNHFVGRNLGVGLAFAHHLSISTTKRDSGGAQAQVDTGSLELLVDLLFRWPLFEDKSTTPVLKAALGFGMRDFTLDPNHVLPSFQYRFLRIGVDAEIPLMTPLIALKAGIDVRPILAVGQEALDALGEKSGVFALAVKAGLGGKTSFGLFYGAMFEYQHFMADYAGRTEYLNKQWPTDAPKSMRIAPSSTTESYIRVWFLLGYAI